MDPIVENEAKLHITNGIEKASSATGVDIKVSIIASLKICSIFVTVWLFEQMACKIVKEQMDRQYGHSFHCVMGEGFSFEVTRQANNSLYIFYSGKLAVLLFKCWAWAWARHERGNLFSCQAGRKSQPI